MSGEEADGVLEPALEGDYPAIVALVNLAYRGSHGGAGSGSSWNSEAGIVDGPRLTEALLREDVAAKPLARLLVWRAGPAEADALLGTVWLEPKPDGARTGGAWYLGLLTVRPDRQQQSLGRRLLLAAEAFARGQGAARIQMLVLNVRVSLIEWYQRRGYQLAAKTEAFPYGDERFGKPLRDDLHFVTLAKTLTD